MKAHVKVRGSGESSSEIRVAAISEGQHSKAIQEKWQRVLNALALAANIPAALIMQIEQKKIKVHTRSSNPENVYEVGACEGLGHGLYCETVLGKKQALLVPDANADPLWQDNPDVLLGMISYYGLPVQWPDESFFGTICILDSKPNDYSQEIFDLVAVFRDTVEADLELIDASKEREKLIVELETARDQALESSRIKSSFLSVMSHELRTPLTPIIGCSEILSANQLSVEDSQEMAGMVHDAGLHMLNLIDDILDLAKLDKKTLTVNKREVSPREILKKVHDLFQADSRGKDFSFSLEMDDSTPSIIKCDPLRLHQILMNLISNAFKFTTQGFVRLSSRVDFEAGQLLIQVEDSSIGIPGKDLARIFDAFTQVDSSNTRKYGGTGLGLDISNRLAGLLGGSLTVSSEEGKGSTFSLRLPLVETQSGSSSVTGADLVISDESQNLKVLLIEDDYASAILIRRSIKQAIPEAEVQLISHSNDALPALNHSAYDLMFIDVHLPLISGIDLIKLIRKGETATCHDTYAVSQSADTSYELKSCCLEAGFDQHFTKPIDTLAFNEVINGFLRTLESRSS